jgi:hypothetical protein
MRLGHRYHKERKGNAPRTYPKPCLGCLPGPVKHSAGWRGTRYAALHCVSRRYAITLTLNATDVILTEPANAGGCARCVEYERRIAVLQRQLAAWEEWEEAALLHDNRNEIRLDSATRRERCGLSPEPGG